MSAVIGFIVGNYDTHFKCTRRKLDVAEAHQPPAVIWSPVCLRDGPVLLRQFISPLHLWLAPGLGMQPLSTHPKNAPTSNVKSAQSPGVFFSRQEGGWKGTVGEKQMDFQREINTAVVGVRVFAADMGRLCRHNGKWSASVALITPVAPMPPSGNEMGNSLRR